MKSEKTDRRIKYTKTMLRQGLLSLLQERPINKITVTDICEKADINRSTFYTHYKDPYDLLKQIENELSLKIQKAIDRPLNFEKKPELLLEICEAIKENGDLCKILFSEHADKEFLENIIDVARKKGIDEWSGIAEEEGIEEFDLLYVFTASGSVGVLQSWVRGSFQQSPREIAEFIDKISTYGLKAFRKKN